ncbi:M4 family metallopeptidase [Actinoplanes rectilineatus]|uniref:M4 family metallopeptidase n=2 Tax=Actinoplanes TaxID=1865 RepID=UPI0005F27A55
MATVVATAMSPTAATARPAGPTPDPAAAAAAGAEALVGSRPAVLQAGASETFHQRRVIRSGDVSYVAYDRSYRGLPVVGGDFVVVTDTAGRTRFTSVAQTRPIGTLSTTPRLSAADATATAKALLTTVTTVEPTTLVVFTAGDTTARLAWQTTVSGTGDDGPSRLTVEVDAQTGDVLDSRERVIDVAGTGTGWINGAVSVNTTQSGSTYLLQDPSHTTIRCQNATGNATFSGPDNVWGNGVGTNRETGCVDAFYVAQQQYTMLSSWLGRNGQNGSGGAWPIRVGLADQNAYYDGTQVQIGRNSAGQWIASADVVGHELGHGIDDTTPGGISRGGTQEFIADTLGAATEWYINNPNDTPDFQVGEEVNLVGSGPIRYMYNPSLISGHNNCYSSSVPNQGVHAASGPGNHWFYLLARGTSGGGNGQPASTTCNSTTLTGIGIQPAIKILYNAMLMKTSSSSYLRYRVWTLQAARNLYPNSCTEFNAVKAAWTAVSVPAQSGEPTC